MSKKLRLSRLKNADAFTRTGIIEIPVGGELQRIEFCTRGWEEARDAFKLKNPEPLPPVVGQKLVDPDSKEGKDYNLSRPEFWPVYDREHPTYRTAVYRWNSDIAYHVSAHVLTGLELEGEDGKTVETTDGRAAELRALGMTTLQAQQIFAEVVKLSALAGKEAADFFGGSFVRTQQPTGGPPPQGSSGTSTPAGNSGAPSTTGTGAPSGSASAG